VQHLPNKILWLLMTEQPESRGIAERALSVPIDSINRFRRRIQYETESFFAFSECFLGTLAIAQVCEQRQVPLVVNIAAAPQITDQGYKFLVRNFPTAGMLIGNGLKLIKDLLEAAKATPKSAAASLTVNGRRVDGQMAERLTAI